MPMVTLPAHRPPRIPRHQREAEAEKTMKAFGLSKKYVPDYELAEYPYPECCEICVDIHQLFLELFLPKERWPE